jgi:PAS domain S-box-containing protein
MIDQPFEGEILDARQRLAELERRSDELPSQHRALAAEILESFSTSLEELQLAGAELRRQNEEQLASRRQLEAAHRHYQDLFEFAPDGYLITDAEGIIREANRAAGELLAVLPRHLIGQPLVLFIAPKDRKLFHSRLTRLHEEWQQPQATAEWEVEIRSRARRSFPAALTMAPVCDDKGRLASMRWLLRDVSASKRADERERLLPQVEQDRQSIGELVADLQRDRDILHTVMENTVAQVAYLDPQFNFVLVNSAYARGSGHASEDLIGQNHFQLFPNPENQAIFERVRDTGEPIQYCARPFEFADQPERGTTYWDWSLVPVKDERGQVEGLVLSLLDVTVQERARRRIESLSAQAQRQAAEMEAILNAIPESVAVWDTQAVLLRANPASATFGIGPEGAPSALLVQRAEVRYPDGRAMAAEESVVALTLRGETILDRQEIMVNPAGEQHEIVASGAPIFSGGEIAGAVVVTHDVTKQRQAERELERLLVENRAQREFLERLLEAAPVGIAVLRGKDHRYELANPYYRGITGVPDTPMVGRTIGEVIPDLVKRGMPELMDEVYRTGQTVSTREVQLSFGPGREETYWNTERVPLKSPDGTVEGILVLAQEVTSQVLDRRRIEALSAQAQRQADEMAAVFAALVEPLMVFDTTGAILRANPAAVESLGIDPVGLPEAFLGQIVSVCYPDGRPIPADDLVAVRALRGETVHDEYQVIITAGGRERAIVVSAAPIVTGDQILGAVVAWHDITDLQRAEAALRESEEKLSTLFELMPVGISVMDGERRISHANAALMHILGLSREALIQGNHQARTYLRSDGSVMPPDEFPSARAWQDQKPAHDQVGIVKEDGAVIWTDVSAAPVPFADWKVVVATVDVTARKQIEQALRQARDELERRVQERTAELERANLMLLAEIRERTRVEGQLRQSEQRLEQRVEERTRELATLLDISNTVALSIDLEPLLAMILERLKDVVDYDGGAAFRLEAGTLNPVFHRGAISADDLLQIGSHLEEAVLGQAAIPGVEQVILADVQGEPALQEAFRRATGAKVGDMAKVVRAWMTVPVTIKQQVYGVLYMYHGQPGRYTEQQARLALPFGNQAAVAIENARIYEQAAALAALEERQYLARELHDAVTQTLFSASLAAEVLPRLWERDREAGLRCLSEVHQLTRGALAEMRTLLLELRPSALVETNLGALLNQLAEATRSRARIPVTVQAEPHCSLLPDVQVALYRIAQEALNNAAKHAGARHVEVSLECTPPCLVGEEQPHPTAVRLCVADDGRGFDPGQLPAGCKGLGLGIMRERAGAIGAAFQIQSQTGQGTRITVRWPDETSDFSPIRPLALAVEPNGG